MRKWLIRFIILSTLLLLFFSHQDILGWVSNFIIDGIIPGTHIALNTFCTYLLVIVAGLGIWKLVQVLRFEMLRREALIYNAFKQTRHAREPLPDYKAQPLEAEDLELV